jgi:RND family efflux transporter MFP subunit
VRHDHDGRRSSAGIRGFGRRVAGCGHRAADCPLHPGDRFVDRRRPGQRRCRDSRPRRGHAGRARHAGDGRHRARSHFVDRDRRAVEGSRGERGPDRSAARPHRGGVVRRERGAGSEKREGADSEFSRIKSLLDQRVVSQSEYDQRKTQLEAASQQFDAAKNAAGQQFQSLLAARARVTLASKALADTVVRAPFAGIVAERTVSSGDYVTKGLKVATVVRITPLRVRLTIPEQLVSAVGIGQPVTFEVDAYPDRTFQGTVKYVSPALEANQRALTVEASVPNPDGALKPGLFVTARVEQPQKTPAVLVPAAAVQTTAGTSRVYVVSGDHVDERIVTIGQSLDALVEVTNGLKAGDRVATKNVTTLADGTKVS